MSRKAKAGASAPSRHARARARVQAPVVRADSTPLGVRGDSPTTFRLICDHCGEPTTEIVFDPSMVSEDRAAVIVGTLQSVLCAKCVEANEAGAGYEEIDDDIENAEEPT